MFPSGVCGGFIQARLRVLSSKQGQNAYSLHSEREGYIVLTQRKPLPDKGCAMNYHIQFLQQELGTFPNPILRANLEVNVAGRVEVQL